MKRLWIITAGLLAVALAGITVWHLLPAGAPEPGELYRRYEHQPGVRVGYIESYRFDDSTLADVVTLEALDSAGWHWMTSEFDLQAPDAPAGETVGVDFWQRNDGKTVAFLSWSDKALCLVQPRSDKELEHIVIYHLQKLKQ